MNKNYTITQKILGALLLASGVVLALDFISLLLVMVSGLFISGIFGTFLLVAAVMTFIAGSKLFNATTCDFLLSKSALTLIIIVGTFGAPQLILRVGDNVLLFNIAIFTTIALAVAPFIILKLTTKK